MIYYKVVDCNLKSVIICDSKFEVQYEIGKWVKPKFKGSALCVFNNTMDAYNFASSFQGLVFECQVKNPRLPIQYTKVDDCERSDCCDSLKNMWQKLISFRKKHKRPNIKYLMTNMREGCWPSGTIWVNEVKLIKQV